MNKTSLPDAEALLAALTAQMRAHVTAQTGLVGIVTGGAWLAERLHRELQLEVPHGSLDVSFYRDDFQHKGLKHKVTPSTIPFEVEGRDLILVDDVLYTGRTIRAAMNELFDYGRPASIRLAALVDRGGRELPIAAQFVGTVLALPAQHNIELKRDAQGRLSLALQQP
ncbi:MAG: bifunctional pyr operon transcriptional regulator/uracil phosphoribosyltransferase PyrR [Pseudomonadota bacterium]